MNGAGCARRFETRSKNEFYLPYLGSARFEPVQQSELRRVKFKTQVWHGGEILRELAQDVNKLIRFDYSSAPADIREQLSKDCFIDALNDPDLEWTVIQGKPKLVEDALKRVRI